MRTPRLLTAALAAAERGWPVFPVAPRGRRPAVKQWGQVATTDPDVLAAFWNERPYNIGIATGPAGLVVLDLDDAHAHGNPTASAPQHGQDVLTELATHADTSPPTETYTVHTPSGGKHLYFLAPTNIWLRNTTGATGNGLGPLIDVRAEGGMIIAAGSTRPDGLYRADPHAPHEPIPLPEWLTTRLTPPPPPQPAPLDLPPRRLTAYTQGAVRRRVTDVTTATVGTRRSVLLSAAASLGRFVGRGTLDYREAWHHLTEAASIHIGTNDFGADEAETTIRDGLNFGINHAAPPHNQG